MADHGYEVLLEEAGWSFMREDEGFIGNEPREYIMLAHMGCPNGIHLTEPFGNGMPSVMHFETHHCQRCGGTPPDGLFATYKLYAWGTGHEDL